jgi:hypothetical protein
MTCAENCSGIQCLQQQAQGQPEFVDHSHSPNARHLWPDNYELTYEKLFGLARLFPKIL